jgi:nucleoside-diphosphate-sugar epimerase
MTDSSEVHVVLGATGGAGRAVVRELADRGRRVRAVSRSGGSGFPEGVEVVAADGADADMARRVCEGAAAVYHCMNVPYAQWADLLPALTEGSIAGAARAGAPLVVMDNLYMYGPTDGPMAEDTPRRPAGSKGRLRLQMEQMLLKAHASGRARVAIGRASDFYGPGANSAAQMLVFDALAEGRTPAWLGSLDAPHTMTYLPDAARGLVALADNEEAHGEVWHLPSNEPVTGRQFIEAVAKAMGHEAAPRMRAYGRWMMALAGLFDAQVREAKEVLYQFEAPFVMDTSKFEAAFGRTVTPYETAIRETVERMEE